MKKSVSQLIIELSDDLKELNEENDHFETKGDKRTFKHIATVLRSLVGIGGRSKTHLLFMLSEKLNIEIDIFSLLPEKIDENLQKNKEELLASFAIGKTWSTEPFNGCKKYTMREWVKAPLYFLPGNKKEFISRNTVINEYADNEVVHHDPEISKIVEDLRGIEYIFNESKINGLEMVLRDTAPAVFWAGSRLKLLNERGEAEELIVYKNEESRKMRILAIDQAIAKNDAYFKKLQPFGTNFSFQIFGKKK